MESHGAEGHPDSETEEDWEFSTCRHTDTASGIVVEMRTDGVPVGLAIPGRLLELYGDGVTAAVLRAMVAANAKARELLEREAGDF